MRERRAGLEVFLDDADVPIDTNHLERSLRGIALGRHNFLFAGSDAGGERAAAMYSLIGAYFTPLRTPISRHRGQRFTRRRTPFHADRGQRFSLMADSDGARE